MQRLTDTLSRDVHVPINQWHKRYGELKDSVIKELDVARKHYDAASQDLNKTKACLLPPEFLQERPAGLLCLSLACLACLACLLAAGEQDLVDEQASSGTVAGSPPGDSSRYSRVSWLPGWG